MSGNAPAWLVARPIAHRGLHDAAKGVVENTLGAAEAAIRGGFAIECDVQLSRDGEAMVFHDDTLDRLTRARGAVIERTVAEIQAAPFRDSDERAPTLPQLLACIAGRTPLICELKSRFDGDMRLADRVAALARDYAARSASRASIPRRSLICGRATPASARSASSPRRATAAGIGAISRRRRRRLAPLSFTIPRPVRIFFPGASTTCRIRRRFCCASSRGCRS